MPGKKALSKFISLFVTLLLLWSGAAFGAHVSFVRPIHFGVIVVDPVGEIIEIDAKSGAAAPRVFTAGNSYVTGGFSGLVRVYSDVAGQMISPVYPVSVNLTTSGAGDLVLDGIDARSTGFTTSTSVGDVDFNIGGLLHIGSGQASKNYSGTMTITIDVINP